MKKLIIKRLINLIGGLAVFCFFASSLLAGVEAAKYESITIDGTTKTLTAINYKPTTGPYNGMEASSVLITVETKPIRFTVDGTTPVAATTGHLLQVGDTLHIEGFTDIKRAKFTEEAAGENGTIRVTYLFSK